MLTERDLIVELSEAVTAAGGQDAYAKAHRLNVLDVRDMLAGRRASGAGAGLPAHLAV